MEPAAPLSLTVASHVLCRPLFTTLVCLVPRSCHYLGHFLVPPPTMIMPFPFGYIPSLVEAWLTCNTQDTQGGNPNNNALCGKKVQVTIGGKSTTVTIADRCAGCAEWDLDLTPTAFNAIVAGGEAVGRTTANWQFV